MCLVEIFFKLRKLRPLQQEKSFAVRKPRLYLKKTDDSNPLSRMVAMMVGVKSIVGGTIDMLMKMIKCVEIMETDFPPKTILWW